MQQAGRLMRGLTVNLVNAGLAAGSTSTYTTTANTVATINGIFATALAAASNTATPTTDVNTGAAFVAVAAEYGCVFVFGVNAAGAIKVAQGSREQLYGGVTTTPGSFEKPPQFPTLPDDFVAIGYVVVKLGPSASSWTFGSSSWTASGVTTSFKNVSCLPDRPQIA